MTNNSSTAVSQARVGVKARFVPDPQAPGDERPLILSYLGMRELAGWVGVILPFAVALGNWPFTHTLEGSISAYYFQHTVAWFVGSLWVIGFFMVSCRGYDKWDELSGRLAGCFALGVALLPMNIHNVPDGWVHYRGYLHWTCAALLFIVLALTSLCLFTKSDSPDPSPEEEDAECVLQGMRLGDAGVHRVDRLVQPAEFVDEALYDRIGQCQPVFWLEAGAVVSFGVAWLVKGESFEFLRD